MIRPFLFGLTLCGMLQGTSVNELIKGYQHFRDFTFQDHEKEFLQLAAQGQFPKTLFIACSDSRVVPSLIVSGRPGSLFEVRNAGNFVPNSTPSIQWDGVAASIQYAVEVLNVREIVVCGHSQCGAIEALFKDLSTLPPTIKNWIQFGKEAKTLVESVEWSDNASKIEAAARLSVIEQMRHLATYPFIRSRLDQKTLFLHGWYFVVGSGELEYFDPVLDGFFPLREERSSVSPTPLKAVLHQARPCAMR